jgi:lipid II:glycine glycyltransferase (peptidoglycan interpeptide bridge formation enzyme)
MNETIRLSDEFCQSWKTALSPFFEIDKDFVIIKSLFGKSAPVYLPYLNYSNLLIEQLPQLLEYIKTQKYSSYNIRILDFNWKTFKENDPVTMRLELNNNPEFVWKNKLNTKARNQTRKAQKSGVVVKSGVTQKLFYDFYSLYKKSMKLYGTPAISSKVIQSIVDNISSIFFVGYLKDLPVSAILLTNDCNLAWVPWGASDKRYNSFCPSNLVYWSAIENACISGKDLFDFGRSPFGGNTYLFKKQWGAYPTKINIITNEYYDIYNKYRFASSIWKNIPAFVTNSFGPFLSKHLTEL